MAFGILEMAMAEQERENEAGEGPSPWGNWGGPFQPFGQQPQRQQPQRRQQQPQQPQRQQPQRQYVPPAQPRGMSPVLGSVVHAAARAEIGLAANEAIRPNKCAGLAASNPLTVHADGAYVDMEVELPGWCTVISMVAREVDDENFLLESLQIDDVQLVHSGPVGLTVFLAQVSRELALTPVIQRTFMSAVKVKARVRCVNAATARFGAITINMQVQPCAPPNTQAALGVLNSPNTMAAQQAMLGLARAA